jgi:hypothetical protein
MRFPTTDSQRWLFCLPVLSVLLLFASAGFAADAPSAVCRLSFQEHGVEYASCEATLVNERDLLTNASCVDTTTKDKSPTATCGEETKTVTFTRVHEGFRYGEAVDPKKPDDQVFKIHDNLAIFSLAKGDSFKVTPAKVDWDNKAFLSRCSVAVYKNEVDRVKNQATMVDISGRLISSFGSGAKLIASKRVAKDAVEPVGAPLFCKDFDNNEVLKGIVSVENRGSYFYTRVDQNVDFINPASAKTRNNVGTPRAPSEQQ